MKQFETFGKYILVERLAAGGMAEVFLAKSTGAGGISKFVAIKRILPQYSDNPEFIDMFKEEARIAMNLSHGNVVSINEFGIENRQFYLVMEYVEGQNLRQILNQLKKETKDFALEQCIYITREIAAGLDHAHRCIDNTTGRPLNITHRDMSPQNIMISFEGEVKVVDFGIAKAESEMEQTRAGTIKGKFGYMSPEQAEGLPVDARTDIFSLGIVLWELLARDRLFTASSEAATLRKIRDCEVPSLRRINPSIPPELERIVNKALAKDKSLRYQAASALHRDLNRFINTQYPDFSQHDFAVFMKSVFSQVYIENRKKQVEFAKVKNAPVAAGGFEDRTRDKTQVTQTDTGVGSGTKSSSKIPSSNAVVKSESSTNASYTVKIEDNHAEALALNPGEFTETSEKTGLTKVDLSQMKTKIKPLDKFGAGGVSRNTGSYRVQKKKAKKNTQHGSQVMAFVIVLLFIVGSLYWGLSAGYIPLELVPKEIAHRLGFTGVSSSSSEDPAKAILETHRNVAVPEKKIETPPPPPPPIPEQRKQNIETVTVVIESQPQGARLYIDGADTGMLTPVRRQVELKKDFKLGLVKDGFSYYEKIERISAPGVSIKVALQVPPPMGYVSINVINGGTDPVVYVNGQRIAQKPPIRFYGVPANTPVTIRILNPFTQLAAEKTVIVKASEKKELNLILNREALTP